MQLHLSDACLHGIPVSLDGKDTILKLMPSRSWRAPAARRIGNRAATNLISLDEHGGDPASIKRRVDALLPGAVLLKFNTEGAPLVSHRFQLILYGDNVGAAEKQFSARVD
jgi:hypothetical protein